MARFITIAIILVAGTSYAQNIWVADNNYNAPTGDHVFTSLQDAINAADTSTGRDIVMVQPSPNSYGNVIIDRKLTLMGIGFNVDKDIPMRSIVGDINLSNNIDNTSHADSVIIMGIQLNNLFLGTTTGTGNYTLQDVLINNCQVGSIRGLDHPLSGIEIRNCYIFNNYSGYGFYSSQVVSNLLFRNNWMYYNLGLSAVTSGSQPNRIENNILYGGIYVSAPGTNTTIKNNNFMGQSGTESAFDTKLKNCIVSSNIFYGSTPSISPGGTTSLDFEANIFNNNLVYSTGNDSIPPPNNTGVDNLKGSPLFANVPLLNEWADTYDFTLDPLSPAIGNGELGTDIGITGGSYPITEINFSLKTTAAPVIQILNSASVINPGDDLPIRVKAKSH